MMVAPTAGNHTADDLSLARTLIESNETILAVNKVSEEQAAATRTNDLLPQLPLAILFFPCSPLYCADWWSIKATILSRIQVVTTEAVYQQQTTHSICGDQEIRARLPITEVNSTAVTSVNRCTSQETYVVLGVPPGSPMANDGGQGRRRPVAPMRARMLMDAGFAEGFVAAIERARGSAAPGVQAMDRPTTQLITELKDLLDAGALTQAEFEAKKAELLQRL